MNNQLITILFSVSITLLLAIACIVSFKRKTRDPKAGFFLSLMYWSFFYALFIGSMGETGYIVYVPHLIRTGQIAALLFMPMSFLYIHRTFNPRPWKWTDWLHFLPVLIYLVDYSVFFLLPAAEKITVYHSIHGNVLASTFSEGLFAPKWFHVTLRYLVMVGYWIAQFICLRNAKSVNDTSFENDQPSLFIWLKWLSNTQLIIILPPLLNLIFHFEKFWIIAPFSAIIASFIQGYFLLMKPEILYGLEGTFRGEDIHVNKVALPSEKSNEEKSSLKNDTQITDQRRLELMKGIIEKLESHFLINKPYLKQGYGLSDLSTELGYTNHMLSFIINKHFGMNFYSLINQYRIEACKDKLKQGEYQQKTLEAIANESGFHSRATFIRAFKNHTGVTPSTFMRKID